MGMSSKRLSTLIAAALLVLTAGCDLRIGGDPADPEIGQACQEEGFDPGTTEYAECTGELVESD